MPSLLTQNRILLKIPPVSLITIIGLLAAACTTFSFLPQAVKTIRTKDTTSISLSMYALFTVGTLLWFLYGLFSNNIPVYLANGITLIFAMIILLYKLKYK
jgi:MtN3 and saliva related transmembrane protein